MCTDFNILFLKENPQYRLLVDAEEETRELLLWAVSKKYIAFTQTPSGSSAYSQDDLEKAKMWKKKAGGVTFES